MKKFNVFNVASIFVFVSISFLVSLISAFSVSKLKFSTLRFTAVIISFFYRRCESLVHLLAPPSLMVFIIYLIQPPDALVYTGMVLQAAALPKGAKVEIEAVAIVGNISDA